MINNVVIVSGSKVIYLYICAKSLQSCLPLCNPMDCRLLCPWDSPGKNTGMGCHFLLQGIFLTQGSNPHLRSPALADGFFIASTIWEAPLKHIHVSILFQILFPFRLLHNIEQSSLCCTVGPCWLSFLNIAVYTSQSHAP